MRGRALAACCGALLLVPAAPANAATGGAQPKTAHAATPIPGLSGGAAPIEQAAAPVGMPAEVRRAIASASTIVGRPYIWGGGHRSFTARGYDCSGAVSYLLHGGGLLDRPLDSGSFMRWGVAGKGRWITVWTNPGHAFVEIAGRRLDTSAAEDPTGRKGPQWRKTRRSHRGFVARHPAGF